MSLSRKIFYESASVCNYYCNLIQFTKFQQQVHIDFFSIGQIFNYQFALRISVWEVTPLLFCLAEECRISIQVFEYLVQTEYYVLFNHYLADQDDWCVNMMSYMQNQTE